MTTPRKRTTGTNAELAPDGKFEEIDDIPDDEKLRILEQTGLLSQLPPSGKGKPQSAGPKIINAADLPTELAKEADEDPLRDAPPLLMALLYSLPAAFIFFTFEILVQQQYGVEWSLVEALVKAVKAYPVLLTYIYLTQRYQTQTWLQVAQWAVSTAAGSYFIHLNLTAPAIGIMQRSPGLMTIWIYGIFVSSNKLMVANLLIVAALYRFDIWKMSPGR
ncbi:hypothetical protein IWQ60_001056 [Tieghemiomyces parasiticus]|uniref:DUF7719 domain-containing protein n=1 Tax=Tieghemiomyces parasiticus TaxID=78921 RepID=A0A9W8AKJ1_9FUNG|nr:hypothetical protein IWQ60_001056 [Tieghemiomyces parasiticus]